MCGEVDYWYQYIGVCGVSTSQSAEECLVVQALACGDELSDRLEDGGESSPWAVQGQDQGVCCAVWAQDLLDPSTGGTLRPMLQEDPNTIHPGLLDDLSKVELGIGLGQDALGGLLGALDDLGSSAGAGIEANPVHRVDLSLMQLKPGVAHLVQLRDMYGQVVVERKCTGSTDGIDDSVASTGISGDQDLVIGVDDGDADPLLVKHCVLYMSQRRADQPDLPLSLAHSPGSSHGLKFSSQLSVEET
jgi:hypothetical protein